MDAKTNINKTIPDISTKTWQEYVNNHETVSNEQLRSDEMSFWDAVMSKEADFPRWSQIVFYREQIARAGILLGISFMYSASVIAIKNLPNLNIPQKREKEPPLAIPPLKPVGDPRCSGKRA